MIVYLSKRTFPVLLNQRLRRSRHGNYVNGNVAKTGDNSYLHCGFSRNSSLKSNLKLIKSIKIQTCMNHYGVCFTT